MQWLDKYRVRRVIQNSKSNIVQLSIKLADESCLIQKLSISPMGLTLVDLMMLNQLKESESSDVPMGIIANSVLM